MHFINSFVSQVLIKGFRPHPDLLFVLTQKVSKKVKTSPASLEKSAFRRLEPSKLTPTEYVGAQTRTILNRLLLLFFGSPAEVHRGKTFS